MNDLISYRSEIDSVRSVFELRSAQRKRSLELAGLEAVDSLFGRTFLIQKSLLVLLD